MSVLKMITHKLVGIVVGFLSILKKAMCFMTRQRRNSGMLLPTVDVNRLPITPDVKQSVPGNDIEMESWDAWDDGSQNVNMSNNTYNSHSQNTFNSIQNYNRQREKSQEPELEPEVDYFQDMVPRVKRQPKIIIRKKEDYNIDTGGPLSSRLMASESVLTAGPDLDTWQEQENAWDAANEDLSCDADEVIRDKKRLERERRQIEHQKRKIEKDAQRNPRNSHLSAVKLS